MAWHDAIYIALARIPPKNILKISLHIYNAFSKKSPHIYIYIYLRKALLQVIQAITILYIGSYPIKLN